MDRKPKPGYKLVKWYFGKEIEIPGEWNIVKLDDCVIFGNQGVNTAIDHVEYVENGIPIIKAGNIRQDFSLIKTDKISLNSYEKIPEHQKPKINDVLYANIGSQLGSCILVSFTDMITIAWNVFIMRLNNKIIPRYLVYFLNNNSIKNRLRNSATQSTMPFIPKPTLMSTVIILPLIPEQQKIASILGTVDELINKYDSIISQTKRLKQGLMQQLLTKGIGHTKFKKVKWLFGKEIEIPEEWQIRNISEFTLTHKQGFYTDENYSDSGVRLIRISDLHNSAIIYDTMPYLELDEQTIEQFSVSEGDVLFARTGAAIGTYGIVNEDVPAVFASYLIRFRFNPEIILNQFFGFTYSSSYVLRQQNMIRQGSSNVNINAENIKSIKIPIPPLPEQQKITSILGTIDSKITDLQSKKSTLEKLKKGLMQKLLTGQIRVQV